MAKQGDIRSFDDGVIEVYLVESGVPNWWPLELVAEAGVISREVEAFIRIQPDPDSLNILTFVFDAFGNRVGDPGFGIGTTTGAAPPGASTGPASSQPLDTGSAKPPWWDAAVRASGGSLPAWEDRNLMPALDSQGNESPHAGEQDPTGRAFATNWERVRKFAIENGYLAPPGSFTTPTEAQAAAPPGWEATPNGDGTWGWSRTDPQAPQTVFQTQESARETAELRGFTNYQIIPSDTGAGWVIKNNAQAGQLFNTFQEARQNTPAGMRPTQLTNGMWGYEYAPDTSPQNFDDLVFQSFIRGGRDLALQVDAFRDRIEQHNVTPLEALNFAFGVAEDPQSFQDIARLAMSLGGGGATSEFLAAAGDASTAFGGSFQDLLSAIEMPGGSFNFGDQTGDAFDALFNPQSSIPAGALPDQTTLDFPFKAPTGPDLTGFADASQLTATVGTGQGSPQPDLASATVRAENQPDSALVRQRAIRRAQAQAEDEADFQELFAQFLQEEQAAAGEVIAALDAGKPPVEQAPTGEFTLSSAPVEGEDFEFVNVPIDEAARDAWVTQQIRNVEYTDEEGVIRKYYDGSPGKDRATLIEEYNNAVGKRRVSRSPAPPVARPAAASPVVTSAVSAAPVRQANQFGGFSSEADRQRFQAVFANEKRPVGESGGGDFVEVNTPLDALANINERQRQARKRKATPQRRVGVGSRGGAV